MNRNEKRDRFFLCTIIPMIVVFFLFHTFPLLKGVMYSFTNFRGFGDFDFIGLINFKDLFTDSRVLNSYMFTFKFAIVTTIIVNLISLTLALALNSKIKFKTTLRGLYFLPNILGGLIVGYIFNYIFTFILPKLGEVMGSEVLSKSILGSTSLAWIAVVIVVSWQSIAFNTIIYISGLQTIPDDVYEASGIDGAGNGYNLERLHSL